MPIAPLKDSKARKGASPTSVKKVRAKKAAAKGRRGGRRKVLEESDEDEEVFIDSDSECEQELKLRPQKGGDVAVMEKRRAASMDPQWLVAP